MENETRLKLDKIIFFGKILPERTDFRCDSVICLAIHGHNLMLQISLDRSIFSVVVSGLIENIDIYTLKNIVQFQVSLVAASIGFEVLAAPDVFVDAAVLQNGMVHPFGVGEVLSTSVLGVGAVDIHLLALSDSQLQFALEDFREAIRVPHQTSFFCYRSVEAICIDYDKNADSKDRDWNRFRYILRVSRKTLDEILPDSKRIRHGRYADQPWDVRKRHLEITHEIIRRYIALKKSPDGKLDPEVFPEY